MSLSPLGLLCGPSRAWACGRSTSSLRLPSHLQGGLCPALPADPLHYPFGGGRLELIQRLPATPGLAGGEAIGPDLRPFSLSPAVLDPSLGDQLPSSEPSSVAGRAPMFYF